ncbi:MAG: hypothetical protein DHS20C18_29640 [Saprospiraceae bacterium]|nr:MAG: hypothetical protein DHS20C18_29640 [Saprospiraceae bacterium]
MYVIRDKNAKSILHISDADYAKNLKPEEVYDEFDPNTMEMGKTKAEKVPDWFDIDEQGEIAPLTKEAFRALRDQRGVVFAEPAKGPIE